jgi:hypothetical protein
VERGVGGGGGGGLGREGTRLSLVDGDARSGMTRARGNYERGSADEECDHGRSGLRLPTLDAPVETGQDRRE